ncbi:cadmium resistance transporter [Anabaena lutea]|uniref:Cadmium resistance transporter n=1 Tax=Anabaena lutea FACHB-196 TaxID=2692881 RepID=A0ABR8FBG5_9NOST|nr:cadmium resistance transporter [Anabaena lutea]MBD2567104.1 cadmium resistance transporter [Anabaena lutea FACHB-196]
MSELVTTITTGLITFSATNIDDILILLLFFSQVNATLRPHHIVAGQYLGFIVLVILSLPGFFGGLIFPAEWMGLLGLIPIVIGISSLVNQETDSFAEITDEILLSETSTITNFLNPQTYTVASLTVANGSDNISIYVPLFANNNLCSLLVTISLFFLLLAVWCYAAYKLTHQRGIAEIFTGYGNHLVPFILMGLGAFIVLKGGALSPIKLVASCICLLVLLKKNDYPHEIGDN